MEGVATSPLSSGEVNFLYWFMQGSIMDAAVRWAMRRAWGLCDRHTAAWLTVEAAFRHEFLHGPAIVYADIMERAARAFESSGPLRQHRLGLRLQAHGKCHLCAMGLGADSNGYAPEDRLRAGRDASRLRAFMGKTERFWAETVCGRCALTSEAARCRAHLLAEFRQGKLDGLEPARDVVRSIARRARRYASSFQWEKRGTATDDDRAALVSAAGWTGGWKALLACYAAGFTGTP